MNQEQLNERAYAMHQFYNQGYSLEEVAMKWGISKQRVHQIFQHYHLAMREPYKNLRQKRQQREYREWLDQNPGVSKDVPS